MQQRVVQSEIHITASPAAGTLSAMQFRCTVDRLQKAAHVVAHLAGLDADKVGLYAERRGSVLTVCCFLIICIGASLLSACWPSRCRGQAARQHLDRQDRDCAPLQAEPHRSEGRGAYKVPHSTMLISNAMDWRNRTPVSLHVACPMYAAAAAAAIQQAACKRLVSSKTMRTQP